MGGANTTCALHCTILRVWAARMQVNNQAARIGLLST
jgi:hypothetical protein